MMHHLKRIQFLKKLSLVMAGSALFPKFLLSSALAENPALSSLSSSSPSSLQIAQPVKFNENAIVDLHCHPSLKMYLWNDHLWRHHCPKPGGNELTMQNDLEQLSFGNIKGMVAAHYLVEASVEKEWDLLKFLFPLIRRLFSRLANKLEDESPRNFDQVNTMMDILEAQIKIANNKQTGVQLVVAKSFAEFEQAIQSDKIAVAHAIEGAHALGRNFPVSKKRIALWQEKIEKNALQKNQMLTGKNEDCFSNYINNLEALKKRGVCLITFAHFFRNDLVYPVEGIAPYEKKTLGMQWQYTPDKNMPLTAVGEAVAKKMLEIGMVIDLTHSTPAARQGVFAINRKVTAERQKIGKPPRPLVFTHVGAQQVFEYYDKGHYPFYNYYNVSDEEIDCICECNGVIGIIPENFWLTGAGTHFKNEFDAYQFRYGIPFMIQTMKYINNKSRKKDFSNIAIGTDFDGFADNPKDFYKAEQITGLISALKADPEINDEAIRKITSGNAMDLLRYGWGD